jgi:LacI family transcriptional regulator/LacI family repressor for deo operon, udp, cdd, tsx, nupC, and nupG
MAITIKDVAKQAGVAHSTVSRALHGSSLIADETIQRIRRIALEMGYSPSAAARSLKTNRSHALGVIVSTIDDPFFSEILQGIEEVAQGRGYSILMAASQRDPVREQAIVQDMRERHVDGLIICSASFSAEQRRKLLEYSIPIVMVNNQAAEEYRYSIYHDDVDGSRQVTRHLIRLGHKRIAYLGNSLSGRTTLDRLTGFRCEMEAARLNIPNKYIFEVPGGGPEDSFHALEHFLELPDRPTALICFNDMLAIGVLKGLQQAGIRVPGDFSVVGFDNIIFSAYTNPPLTTLDQPKRYIGAEAARLILGLLDTAAGEEAPGQEIQKLKGRLLVRQSTAPPSNRN